MINQHNSRPTELSTVTSQSHYQGHSWTGKVVPVFGTILIFSLKTDLTLLQQFAWFKIRFSTYQIRPQFLTYSLSEEVCLVFVCCFIIFKAGPLPFKAGY